MKLFALFGRVRKRGDLDRPGRKLAIAGVIPGALDVPAREELPPFDEAVQAMRAFCLPCAGNIVNIEYYRLHRGTQVASPPRGTRAHQGSPSPRPNTAGSPSPNRAPFLHDEPGRAFSSSARPGSGLPEGA